MKLESLKKFQENSINRLELRVVKGGKTISDEGVITEGAIEVCALGGCVSYTSDRCVDDFITFYEGVVYHNKPC